MKNRIAVRSEYFRKSQAKGLIAHIKRDFTNDKNVIDKSLTKRNFGNPDEYIQSRYDLAMKQMPEAAKNTLIDSVLVLPLEQLNEVKKNHPIDWKKKLHDRIMSMMKEMSDEMGFEYLGYKMHLDEGHFDERGEVVLNPHAHMLFANICKRDVILRKEKKVTKKDENGKAMRDPKKPSKYLYERDSEGKIKTVVEEINLNGRMPLSLHQTRGSDSIWAKQQDIAAKHLADLGFERGLKAELTQANNKKKAQYVAGVLSQQEQELESVKLAKGQKHQELEDLETQISELEAQKSSIWEGIKARISQFLSYREALAKAVLNQELEQAKEASEQGLTAFVAIPDQAKQEVLDSTQQKLEELTEFQGSAEFDEFAQMIKEMKENKPNSPCRPTARKGGPKHRM